MLAFYLAIVLHQQNPIRKRFKALFVHLMSLWGGYLLWRFISALIADMIIQKINWYGISFSFVNFILATEVIGVIWIFIGAYRLLKKELQCLTHPWVWPLFCLFLVVYCLGLKGLFFSAWLESANNKFIAKNLVIN